MIENYDYENSEDIYILIQHNKNILISILDHTGYDSKFLLEWGIPDFWQENNWLFPEHVIGLLKFLIKKYSLNIPSSIIKVAYNYLQ